MKAFDWEKIRTTSWRILTLLGSGGICYPAPNTDPPEHGQPGAKLYKRRWLMLLIFSLNSTLNACLFITLSAITNIVSRYYQVQPFVIDWLSNIFFLIYFIFGIPAAFLTSIFGLRSVLIVGSGLHAVAGVLRFYGAPSDRFGLVMAGQILASLACCTILQVPARLACVWFGEREQSLATSIGAFMNIFGIALGFCMSSQMVKESKNSKNLVQDIYTLLLLQMVICFALLIVTVLLYQERPPTAPAIGAASSATQQGRKDFFLSLKKLLKDRNFHLVAQAYAIYFGVFNAFSVLLNTIITSRFPQGYEIMIGWMGFTCLLVSIPSTLVLSIVLDRMRNHRCQAICLHVLSCLLMVAFMLVLTQVRSFWALFAIYVVYGLVGVPYYCTGLSHAAVVTYPISESTSCSVILALANLYGFILVLVLGKLANDGHVIFAGSAMAVLYAISLIFAVLVKAKDRNRVEPLSCTPQTC